MQLAHFFIQLTDDGTAVDECNRFLGSVLVLEVDTQGSQGHKTNCYLLLNHILY